MFRFSCIAALLAVLAACASAPVPPPPYPGFSYAEKPVSSRLRVLLIAGSNDSANFAEEVVRQRRLWRGRGVPAEEIGCYYSAPGDHGWASDHAQFARLLPELAGCHPADVKTLESHLARAAKAKPDSLYLYFSGHGVAPAAVMRQCFSAVDGQEAIGTSLDWRLRMEKNFASASQYGLITDAERGRSPRDYRSWVERVEGGEDIADTILTPTRFARMLAKFPARTRKVVVLQGCFSGGFLAPWTDGKKESSLLKEVPNAVVLTASSSNRTSFGCDAGSDTTYYGKAFYEVLLETRGKPAEIDWAGVHARVSEKVRWEERMLRFYPEFYSEPLFKANVMAE